VEANLNLNPDFQTNLAGLIKATKEIKIKIMMKIRRKIPILI